LLQVFGIYVEDIWSNIRDRKFTDFIGSNDIAFTVKSWLGDRICYEVELMRMHDT
jgi:hypothetical protein